MFTKHFSVYFHAVKWWINVTSFLAVAIVLVFGGGKESVHAAAPPECEVATSAVELNYNGPDIISCKCSQGRLFFK